MLAHSFFAQGYVFKSKTGNIGTVARKSLILKGKHGSADWNRTGTVPEPYK
jgi:hypothetical protein